MRFAKWFLVLLMAAVVFVVACMVNETVAAVLLILYFVAGVVLLVKALMAAVRKLTKKKPASQRVAQPVQAEPVQKVQRVAVTKSETVPPIEAPRMTEAANGIERHFPNVGVYMPYLDVLDRPDVVPGAIVTFRQEPENKFDKRAVAVVIGRKRIGYLFRGEYQDMANEWINKGSAISGRIVKVDPEAYRPQANAVTIDMYFYS